MRVRLEPHDEFMHDTEGEQTFNESMYFNVYDPAVELGAFFRVGNRPNEGHAEMTVCIYLPDGRVAFLFARPEIDSNERFDAAGLTFEVLEPFERLRVRYSGKAVLLDDPLQMADPRKAFTENPYADCTADLTYTRVSDMFGGEPEGQHEVEGEEFAKGHYEQLVAARGSIQVGDEAYEIDGYGLRDHSWGKRTWQAPWYYRWLTANGGDDFGFMGSRIARQDREGTRAGFVWDGGQLHLCDDFRIETDWDADGYQRALKGVLRSGDRSWELTGSVKNLIPLRNRRDGRVTRIAEGLTEWTMADGRTAYGWSEYLDQIVDGAPVGIAE